MLAASSSRRDPPSVLTLPQRRVLEALVARLHNPLLLNVHPPADSDKVTVLYADGELMQKTTGVHLSGRQRSWFPLDTDQPRLPKKHWLKMPLTAGAVPFACVTEADGRLLLDMIQAFMPIELASGPPSRHELALRELDREQEQAELQAAAAAAAAATVASDSDEALPSVPPMPVQEQEAPAVATKRPTKNAQRKKKQKVVGERKSPRLDAAAAEAKKLLLTKESKRASSTKSVTVQKSSPSKSRKGRRASSTKSVTVQKSSPSKSRKGRVSSSEKATKVKKPVAKGAKGAKGKSSAKKGIKTTSSSSSSGGGGKRRRLSLGSEDEVQRAKKRCRTGRSPARAVASL